jgi:hypothetical protein
MAAILKAESHEGNWKRLQPGSIFIPGNSGNKIFDTAHFRWVNTNKSIAYTLIGNTALFVETPAAVVVSIFLCEIFPGHFFQERQILPDLPQRV